MESAPAAAPALGSILQGLNEPQRAAVTVDTRAPVLVLAGAGCGKTTVLTRRLAFLAAGFAPAERLLALTFTRRASQEMAARTARLLQTSRPLPVMTFHSLAFRMVGEECLGQRNYKRLGYYAMPRVLSERERLEMLADNTTPRERTALGSDLEGLDARLETHAVHPDRLKGLAHDARELVAAIAERLRAVRRRANVWLFSDIISSALELLRSSGEIDAHYRQRYRAVLVDEFQDTNPLQIRLLNALRTPDTHFYAVGDDDQAIYGFRGADTGPILGFAAQFPGARVLKLEVNYRSTPRILSAANRIARDKPEEYRKVLRAGLDAARGARPRVRHFRGQHEMLAWIWRASHGISRRDGVPVERMAALFRVNETRSAAEEYFRGRGATSLGAPQCITIHGSKGLEFPVVFLCDLEEGILPSYRLRTGRRPWWSEWVGPERLTPADCNLAEERRLFYVAVTRAQRRICLLSARQRTIHGTKRRLRPSRFLRLL